MSDHYKERLRKAAWDWLEHNPRTKDRRSGRAEKRAARQLDRKEIDREIR